MCVLRAYGPKFKVDSFLTKSSLKPDRVYHKGERRFPQRENSTAINKHSGFSIGVGGDNFGDLKRQVREAQVFIKRHAKELSNLSKRKDLARVFLDFSAAIPEDSEAVMNQDNYLPLPLVKAAAQVGIGLAVSVYPLSPE